MKICKCGVEFKPNKITSKYCSNKCKYTYRTRPSGLVYCLSVVNRAWFKKGIVPHNKGKGEGWFDSNTGYRRVRIGGKQKREHRAIIEKYLGRKLNNDEVVHHINHDKTDNRIENLEVMQRSLHISLHKQNQI